MIKVVFKNLSKSQMIKEGIITRFKSLQERFPSLKREKAVVTVSMDNSPTQAGEDLFKVKVFLNKGKKKSIIIEKSSISFHKALANVVDRVHERLRRYNTKDRSKQITRKNRRGYDGIKKALCYS